MAGYEADWRMNTAQTGDWRYCSVADAHHKHEHDRGATETSTAFKWAPPAAGDEQLNSQALKAILAHQNVGTVHRGTPRADPEPATKRHNPIFRFSATNSSWTAPPLVPKSLPMPDNGQPPMSPLHNRRLGMGTPRVQCNLGGPFVI